MTRSAVTTVKVLKGTVKTQTAKAILFILDRDYNEADEKVSPGAHTSGVWFPFSQVKRIVRVAEAADVNQTLDELTVSVWICTQKGIEV